MSGGMPELGSKISLISKADIRYEGRLYTVDPQECTIALSSVRSFGTEDRETQFQIAPQSQIYDYILFRGSDIKDIRVVNNNLPHPNDPAIMQVQLPNGQHLMPHFPMPNMNAPHAPPMNSGAGYPFGGMGGVAGGALSNLAGAAPGGGTAPSLAPGSGAPGPFMHMGSGNQQPSQQQQKTQQQQQPQQKQPISVIDMLAGASRSTTPISLISRKSPTTDLGGNNQQQQQVHQSNNAGNGGNGRDAGHKRQNHQQRGGPHNQQQRNNHNDYYNHAQQHHQQSQHNRDRRDSGRNMDNQYNYNNQRSNHPGAGGGQNRGWNMHRGGGPPNPNMNRNRNPGPRGRMQSQGFRPMGGAPGGIGGNQNKQRNNKINFHQDFEFNQGLSEIERLRLQLGKITGRDRNKKYEEEFDFEQGNSKFEELRAQLAELKMGDDAKSSEQLDTPAATTNLQVNGETDKKDDSGNETGAGEHEPEDEIHVGYDKTKSFFDNISCEAAQDRTKNKKNDWRQERKLNNETFGASSTKRYEKERESSYRGRGNYYNRNAGGGGNYSGGAGGNYNRNYRGGHNQYRNRTNNRHSHGGNNMHNTATTNNNNNNAGNNVAALKQQVQQQQQTSAATTTAGADGTNATTTTTKSTTLQENNTQPQLAAVGAGQ